MAGKKTLSTVAAFFAVAAVVPVAGGVAAMTKSGGLASRRMTLQRVMLVLCGAAAFLLAGATSAAPLTVPPSFGAPDHVKEFGGGPLTLRDVNGDHHLDLVVSDARISVQLGRGDGTFEPESQYAPADGAAVHGPVAVGDLNADGHTDLAVASNGTSDPADDGVVVLPGPLPAPTVPGSPERVGGSVSFPTGMFPTAVAIGDLNNDSRPDLVVTNGGSNTVSVLLRDPSTPTRTLDFQPAVDYGTGDTPIALALADLNHDGFDDIVVANQNGNSISVLFGKADAPGTFEQKVDYELFHGFPDSVAIGDLNGDGNPDLAVAHGAGVSVLLGSRDGTFQDPVDAEGAIGTKIQSVAVADLNLDGRADLALGLSAAGPGDPNISVLPGRSDGTFPTHTDYVAGGAPSWVAVGKLDGDDKPDLALAGDGSWVLLNQTSVDEETFVYIGDGGVVYDATEGNAGTTTVTIPIELSAPSARTLTIGWTTNPFTDPRYLATADVDYQAASGTVVFAPGEFLKYVDVNVIGDTLNEGGEYFLVSLTSLDGAQQGILPDGWAAGAPVSIRDDDPPPSLSVNDASFSEGDAGTKTMTFTASLSAASGLAVTADVSTTDGTATAPGDYTAVPTTQMTFPPGVTTQTVDVQVKGDLLAEPDETFTVALSNPQNATIAHGGTGTILDDDAAVHASFSANPNPTFCGAAVSFDASSSTAAPGRSLVAYAWDFGDHQTGTGSTTTHAYTAQGSYPVTLTVTDDRGSTDKSTVYVDEGNRAPVADTGGPYTARTGLAVTLDGSGSHDPDSACGDSISYTWDLNGDGAFDDATGPTPSVAAADLVGLGLGVGSHTISVRVEDQHGARSTATGTLTIVPRPANDDFADAAALGSGTTAYDTSFATVEPGESFGPVLGPGSVWYTIAPGRGGVKLRAETDLPSGTSLRLTVYTGSGIGALNQIAEKTVNDGVGTEAVELGFPTSAGVTYHIQVSGPTAFSTPSGMLAPGVGAGTLTREFFPAPANDDFSDATPLVGGATPYDTSFATVEPGEDVPFPSAPGTVWFTITPGRGGLKLRCAVRPCGVAVYVGSSVGSLSLVANRESPSSSADAFELAFPTTAGVTYHIRVSGPTVFTGQQAGAIYAGARAGTLTSQFYPAPANDDFADASTLPAGATPFDTSFATVQPSEPGSLGGDPGTAWYTMTPGLGTLSLHGEAAFPSSHPLGVTVYTGSTLGTLNLLKSADASPSGLDVVDIPTFATACGATYSIRVRGPRAFDAGGFAPGIGAGTLTPTFNAASLTNDAFADAQTIQPGTVRLPDNWWTCASAQPSEPAHAGSAAAHSVWYRITPASGKVVLGSPGNRVAVYRGTSLATLTPVANSASGEVTFHTPGGTYLIAVDGGTGTSVAYDFTAGEVVISTSSITTTDDPPQGTTAADPVETTVTRPLAGKTTIFETQATAASTAWTFLGYKVEIVGTPDATATSPYRIVFRIDTTLSPFSDPPLDVFRNGVALPNCFAGSVGASPDPCVFQRFNETNNNPPAPRSTDRVIVVLSSHASLWTFGAPRMTAGTTLGVLRTSSGGDAAFLINSNGKSVTGAFAYTKGGEQFVATSVSALAITGTTAWFAGVGRDGRTFLAYVEDNGPGSRDVFKLWIAGVDKTGTGTLSSGDLGVLPKP